MASYKERMSEYFDAYDANKNGFLDVEDFVIIGNVVDALYGKDPAAHDSITSVAKSFFEQFAAAMDANNDGKISREELLQGIEKLFVGRTYDTAPEWWQKLAPMCFAVFDTDRNGELSLEEMIAGVKGLDKKANDADITKAFNWAIALTGGKFTALTFQKIVFLFATSPDPTPEASLLLPFFRVLNK